MIYLDNAATTKISDEVAEFIAIYSRDNFFNPSGIYQPAVRVASELENARVKLRKLLGARTTDKVVFCSSATEANNIALRCFSAKKLVLISEGEHACVYQSAMAMRQDDTQVELIRLLPNGQLDSDDLKSKLSPQLGIVSVLHVSNETGAINNIKEIVKTVKEKCPKALVHSDGVQAFGKIPVNISDLGVDLYTVSSHKIHGPRGVGALIFRKECNPKTFIFGGGQELNIRSGTENVAAILGFVLAAEKAVNTQKANFTYIKQLKTAIIDEINAKISNFTVNGEIEECSPYILSLSFEGVKGEVLLHKLETNGVLVSTGSSCNSKNAGNRVLRAMGLTREEEQGNIRVSFCRGNTLAEISKAAQLIVKAVEELRGLKQWKR